MLGTHKMNKTWLGRSVSLWFGFLHFVWSSGTGRSFENPAKFNTQGRGFNFRRTAESKLNCLLFLFFVNI